MRDDGAVATPRQRSDLARGIERWQARELQGAFLRLADEHAVHLRRAQHRGLRGR